MTVTRVQIPKLRRHKAKDLSYVRIEGRQLYLGRWNAPETEERYRRFVAEWVASGYRLPTPPAEITVVELAAAYVRFARTYYRGADGTMTDEVGCIRHAIEPLLELYGRTPAGEFSPRALKAVRERMIARGWCRRTVNHQVGRVKRLFRWGTAEELIDGAVAHRLAAVDPLRRGRHEVRDTEPVRPVPQADVEAVLPVVSAQVAALIRLQLITGARAGEFLIMRPVDLDVSGEVWQYRPTRHKTQHHGQDRVIDIGPRAKAIIEPFLAARPIDAFVFSPAQAEADRLEARHARRTTPLNHGNAPGRNRKAKRTRAPRDHYTVDSYRRAIHRACDAAGVERWSPHRLRHNAATLMRREYGLDVARVILGHRSSTVTEVYAELDRGKAVDVVARFG